MCRAAPSMRREVMPMTDLTDFVKLLTALVSLLTALIGLTEALKQRTKQKRRYEKAIWVASPAAQLLSAGSGCHNGL